MNLEPSSQPYTEQQNIASFLEMQRVIFEKQSRGEPFFIGRLSGNEPNLCGRILCEIQLPDYLVENMLLVAGIQFQQRDDVVSYVKTYTDSFRSCDLVGMWSGGPLYEQTKLFCDIISQDRLWYPISAVGIEPYYFMNQPEYDYSRIFENKKVLILTSHSKTIKSQLKRIDQLFATPIFHPSTKLYVHKSPQQNGGNHDDQSWQAHFDILKNDIKRIKEGFFDFDIALVGCGGFGMPICAYIREKLGKSVIYVGGALQLYFGVMGGRWQQSNDILKHVNEHWVRPLDVDKPANPQSCEGGCYW